MKSSDGMEECTLLWMYQWMSVDWFNLGIITSEYQKNQKVSSNWSDGI